MTTIATDAQIEQLRLRAVNDITREIMAHGVTLTHEQADDLGEETLAWIGGRLGLNVRTTSDSVECVPPVHYSGQSARAAGSSTEDELAKDVTDRQITALRTAAAEHDDTAQRIICDMAIDGEDSAYDEDCLDADGRPDYSGGGHTASELAAIRRALRMTQDEARAECARVIAAAEAQS